MLTFLRNSTDGHCKTAPHSANVQRHAQKAESGKALLTLGGGLIDTRSAGWTSIGPGECEAVFVGPNVPFIIPLVHDHVLHRSLSPSMKEASSHCASQQDPSGCAYPNAQEGASGRCTFAKPGTSAPMRKFRNGYLGIVKEAFVVIFCNIHGLKTCAQESRKIRVPRRRGQSDPGHGAVVDPARVTALDVCRGISVALADSRQRLTLAMPVQPKKNV